MEPLTLICDDRTATVEADLAGERAARRPRSALDRHRLGPQARGPVPRRRLHPDVDVARAGRRRSPRPGRVRPADRPGRSSSTATSASPPWGPSASRRSQEMATLQAPDFTVDTIDGDAVSLGDFKGRKKLLVAFSSWCGCRYDLPELGADQPRARARRGCRSSRWRSTRTPTRCARGSRRPRPRFPVLLDRDHVITERYSLVNVPTVVWIDEDDQVVRPNDVAFSDDQFVEFHGIDSGPHLEALRRWVTDDELPLGDADDVRAHQMPPDRRRAAGPARVPHRARAAARRAGRGGRRPLRPGHRRWRRSTSRSAAPSCRCAARTRSSARSSSQLYEEWEAVGRPYYGPRDEPTSG